MKNQLKTALAIRLSVPLSLFFAFSIGSFSQISNAIKIDTSKLGDKNVLGFYSYETDSGYIAIDSLGNLLYSQTYYDINFNFLDGPAAVVSKGELWGFFSLDGKYRFPMSKIKDGWRTFDIDDYSYAFLGVNYLVEIDGKFGKVNCQNQPLISPDYDKLFMLPYINMTVGLKEGQWHFIIDSNETIVHSFHADQWINVRLIEDKPHALFVRNDSLIFKDLDGFKEYYGLDLFEKKHQQKTVYSDEGLVGVITDKGEIIMPFEYDRITIFDYKKEHPYIIASKNRRFGLYTIDGEIRNEHIYEKMSCICQGGEIYFRIQKNGRFAVAKRNDQGKLIPITDFVFASISCYSKTEGKPIATGYYEKYTEPKTYIYKDGRIETEE